jgi:hypothetical protein
MAMDTGFQQQQPLVFSAAVRSTPSPQHAARLRLDDVRPAPEPTVPTEEKNFDPRAKR